VTKHGQLRHLKRSRRFIGVKQTRRTRNADRGTSMGIKGRPKTPEATKWSLLAKR
jgi:hypothetical protein